MTYNNTLVHSITNICVAFIMVFSVLSIIPVEDTPFFEAGANTTWTQSSTTDFNQGTLDNVNKRNDGTVHELVLGNLDFWNNMNPPANPAGIYNFAMSSIYGNDKILLFGGHNGTDYQNNTWLYDLSDNNWTSVQTPDQLYNRSNAAMAPIYGTDKVLLFGGVNKYAAFNDTWIFDLSDGQWTLQTPLNSSQPLRRHAMASIYGDDKVLMFGGYNGSSYMNGTWQFDLSVNNWTKIPTIPTLKARADTAMATVYGTNKVVLFGGFDGTYYDDTFIYNKGTGKWAKKAPAAKPATRRYHSMATIYGTDKVSIFGGISSSGTRTNDTWVYDFSLNQWTEEHLKHRASIRGQFAMASIDGTDSMLMFGGKNTGKGFSDTWKYYPLKTTKNGTYTSPPKDMGATSNPLRILWTATTFTGANIKFQLRSAQTSGGLSTQNWVGPNGNQNQYYVTTNTIITGHDEKRWIQVKAYFYTNDDYNNPRLDSFTIRYTKQPSAVLTVPGDGAALSDNKPIFNWTFLDSDGTAQTKFMVEIDDDINFASVDYDSTEQTSSAKGWHFPEGTSFSTIPDGTWYWRVRVCDQDSMWSLFSAPRSFVIDTKKPASTISAPVPNSFLRSMTIIEGSASDDSPSSGLDSVLVSIKRVGDNNYWTGSNWNKTEKWLTASGKSDWSYSTSSIGWSTGTKYLISSKALDNAGNLEFLKSGHAFTYDTSKPETTINEPTDNSYLIDLDEISGDGKDTGGSEINITEISLKCTSDDTYWSGSSWVSGETWLTATDTNRWTYDTSTISFTSGNSYLVRSRAVDFAGNQEVPGVGISFIFDNNPPKGVSVTINDDDVYTTSRDVTLTLQYSDPDTGVVDMSFSHDGKDWSIWEPAALTKAFTVYADDGEKEVYFRVRDIAGNIGPVANDTIILDGTPPINPTITINEDIEYTNSRTVELTLSADDTLSGLSEMSFQSGTSSWSNWEPYATKKTYTLGKTDGDKKVSFRVRDNAGNVAEAFDFIILETDPPHSLSISINNGAQITHRTSVDLKLFAMDDSSGVYQMSFSDDCETFTEWETYAEIRTYVLPDGDGLKTICFRVMDIAGNIAESVASTITLNTTPTGPPPGNDDNNTIPNGEDPDKKNDETTITDKESSFPTELIIIAVIIVVILVILLFIMMVKKKDKAKEDEAAQILTEKTQASQVPVGAPMVVETAPEDAAQTDDFMVNGEAPQQEEQGVETDRPQFGATLSLTQEEVPTDNVNIESVKAEEESLLRTAQEAELAEQAMQYQQMQEMAQMQQMQLMQQQQAAQAMQNMQAMGITPHTICTTCGQMLIYIPEAGKYFCNYCNTYQN